MKLRCHLIFLNTLHIKLIKCFFIDIKKNKYIFFKFIINIPHITKNEN